MSDGPPATFITLGQKRAQDALNYLDKVKEGFGEDHPEGYEEFLNILKAFRLDQIDNAAVVERVTVLFENHPDLMEGFLQFIPVGYPVGSQRGTSGAGGGNNSGGTGTAA